MALHRADSPSRAASGLRGRPSSSAHRFDPFHDDDGYPLGGTLLDPFGAPGELPVGGISVVGGMPVDDVPEFDLPDAVIDLAWAEAQAVIAVTPELQTPRTRREARALAAAEAAFAAPAYDGPTVTSELWARQMRAEMERTGTTLGVHGSDVLPGRHGVPDVAQPVVPQSFFAPVPQDLPEVADAPTRRRRSAEPLRSRRAGRDRRPPAVGPATAASARNCTHMSVPQLGIAGVLGLATIAAPMAGMMTTASVALPSAMVTAYGADASAPAFPRLQAQADNAVENVRMLPDDVSVAPSVPSAVAAPRTVLVTRASRSQDRAVLPGCSGTVPAGVHWQNGQIPLGDLCTLWDTRFRLRADAAVSLAKLNVAYTAHFGHPICLTDAYRTLASQKTLRWEKPGLAAVPGTSEHGWALAVDMCDNVQNRGSVTWRWLRANAPAYGWNNPDWAQPGGGGPMEPWHWEFLAGEDSGPGSSN